MPSCNTYHLTWVFLTLGVGYLFTAALAKLSLCSLPWMRGISSLPPFVTFNVRWLLYTLLHHATTAHWKWGGSSQPPPLVLGVGLLLPVTALASGTGYLLPAVTPDLRCGISPLGHSCAVAAWHSRPLPLTSDVG